VAASLISIVCPLVKLIGILIIMKVENGWDRVWKEGVTPWDVGNVTPIIQDLVNKGKLPEGRALVPGCGSVSIPQIFLLLFDRVYISEQLVMAK
jgi:hypothetical protein